MGSEFEITQIGLLKSLNVKVVNESGRRVVVLGHGFGLDQSIWQHVVPHLTTCGFKVILLDWAFSGAVDPKAFNHDHHTTFSGHADDLVCILEELRIEVCSFVGHSMAGMIGCLASLKRPELFERLILLCASPRYLNEEAFNWGFSREEVDRLYSAMKADFKGWVSGFCRLVVGTEDPCIVEEVSSTMVKMKPEIALAIAMTIFESDMREVLGQVSPPCFIIQTKEDIAVPLGVAHYMKAKLECSHLDILDAVGHLPQLTSVGLLVKALKNALEEQEAPSNGVCQTQPTVIVQT